MTVLVDRVLRKIAAAGYEQNIQLPKRRLTQEEIAGFDDATLINKYKENVAESRDWSRRVKPGTLGTPANPLLFREMKKRGLMPKIASYISANSTPEQNQQGIANLQQYMQSKNMDPGQQQAMMNMSNALASGKQVRVPRSVINGLNKGQSSVYQPPTASAARFNDKYPTQAETLTRISEPYIKPHVKPGYLK